MHVALLKNLTSVNIPIIATPASAPIIANPDFLGSAPAQWIEHGMCFI